MKDLHQSPLDLTLVWFILISLLISCSPSLLIESKSSRRPYDYEASTLHPEISTYLHSDTLSVYINIDRDELLYTREGDNKPFTAKALVQLNEQSWIWSDTLKSETPRWIYNRFDIMNFITEESTEYSSWLNFVITDQNRNSSIKDAVEIRKVLLWNMV